MRDAARSNVLLRGRRENARLDLRLEGLRHLFCPGRLRRWTRWLGFRGPVEGDGRAIRTRSCEADFVHVYTDE